MKHIAEKGRQIMAIGAHAWGVGQTSTEALRRWRKAVPWWFDGKFGRRAEIMILEVADKFEVDEFGRVRSESVRALETRDVRV